ncbi:hypothetical protein FA15DRAFT_379046 [Coprinopsis marcescibilis]|uniref:Uncharacterized protein n=1 Tax=Coprinopsis marcescibilis TaxID=230819 RepID=A0A5C3L9Y6_COPMA|nr:hypothetical protein FA15DRAFT_379046 [Coprinopsis marcescibilis]
MSAMLGTFDMPMSDYPNDDVLMHTHSSDPWAPQEDGIMEEDNITPFTALHKSSMMELNSTHTLSMSGDQMFYSETGPADLAIEVEMDDYTEDGNAEYEMLDDLNLIAEDVPEIQDVEVVDVQSSADSSLSEIPRPPQIAPVEAATIVSTTTHSESIDAAITSDSHSEPKEKNFESADGEAKSATSTHDNVGDATDTKPLPDDGPTASHKDSENVQHTHEVGQATPIVEDTLADGEPSQSEVPVPKASGSETVDSADTAHLGNFTPQTAEDTITVQATVEDHQEVELNSTENHEGEARTSTQQESVLQESEPPAPNPHEIAEGVYIEPPPGVLLNAWFTPNPCPLFNRPLPSGVATPQVEGDGTADILLHDRPTMFYEPLSSLFAALREEELFAKQEELQQVELVLAVETLQLSVSEDNIYSREISLHDIHLLHESFHTGPLRMELQHLSPRFITRYHELQDHLQRVGEDDVTDIASAVPASNSLDSQMSQIAKKLKLRMSNHL